jgi:nucleotide-binding universal stress UspA family protein
MAIETILLAVGPADDDRADMLAESVIDIAGPLGADVVIGHVFTEEEFDRLEAQLDADGSSAIVPELVARRQPAVRTIGERLDAAAVSYSVEGEVGDHAEAIVRLAEDVGADRVFVGGRKRSPTGKAMFGSTAQQVMLNAPCPVTYVRDAIRPSRSS